MRFMDTSRSNTALAEPSCQAFWTALSLESTSDLSRFCRFWSAGESHLPPPLLEQALTRLPLEADWALEPFLAEQSFNALGLRCLQVERHKRRHACLPPQAVLEVRSDDEKAEATLPTEKVLHERFEVLWTQCLGAFFGLLGRFACVWWKQEMAATQQMKEACLARYIMSARALAQQPVSRRQYESIFPNISDILAVSSVNLRAGQVVVVRYRLAGACNFWHPKHRVLKDEREPLPWPVPSKVHCDDVFVYDAVKTIRIRDARLGLLQYGMMLLIATYIVVWQLLRGNSYLMYRSPTVSIRMTLQQPTVKSCNPNEGHCQDAFKKVSELPYVDGVGGTQVYPNDIVINTFRHEYTQERNSTCGQEGCSKLWVTSAAEHRFMADVEESSGFSPF
eukprot:g12959.t1